MIRILHVITILTAASCCFSAVYAATDADWQAMAKYEYGQDMKPLLAVECEMTAAINSPKKTRGVCPAAG